MRVKSEKLRVATVGTGYFSRFQYAAWDRLPEVELVAICNRSPEAARELAERYSIGKTYQDFELMLDEVWPDLVDIITPPTTHTAYVRAAVQRGIPVICQKPFTPSISEARVLTEFIESKQAKVIIHENFRFQPWYLKLKELLNRDVLGELYQISYCLRPGDGQGPEAYLDRQPYFQQMERLLVHETAVHLIDVFRFLFGEISSIYADLRRINPVIRGEDAGILLFEFQNTTRGVFDGNRLSDHAAQNHRLTMGEMCIEGAAGTLSLDGSGDLFLRKHGARGRVRVDYDWQDRDFGGDCVFNLQRHVVDHLLRGTEVMNVARDYLVNVEIAEAAYLSHAQGKRISLP
ncbi:Gfo/Idh/MocA family oxidoreductase [Kiloniella laminariae]|uniref:Gfo/Idh/MocA family oxidoreductase n=1 Tax=Kiloniella laminariae TaxID=454162 RepID=A0ABT4LK46_9PROT|nr:Gfo/Idh/MocA family oxidoreductase [Kiloniella laminariae]MCZ4281479.1 Gfo/Idh/MocA family oxidoreductase [Kiloniella laminariae]